jgi:hypothetical protein
MNEKRTNAHTSIGRSRGHEDVDVSKDPDPKFEIFIISGDVLSAADLDRRLRNRYNVDVQTVVFLYSPSKNSFHYVADKLERLAARGGSGRTLVSPTQGQGFEFTHRERWRE